MAKTKKILAVASAGGHWTQMMRLRPAFDGAEMVFASTLDFSAANRGSRFYILPEANKNQKIALLHLLAAVIGIVFRERPDVVISTGAAPGLIALFVGRLLGARTVWIDSLANVDKLSLSGKLAKWGTDAWLTQWPHLAKPEGPHHLGAVL